MVKGDQEQGSGKGLVADLGGQTAGTLSVLWDQRKYACPKEVLLHGLETDPQVAQSAQSTRQDKLAALHGISEALPVTRASNRA